MRNHLAITAALAVISVAHAYAQSSAYPTKPMRWVVPFAPGGGIDVIARPVAQKLSERVGQSVLYENRGGGGGLIAGEIVARATPDGYTMLVAAVAVMTVTVSLVPKIPFDPVKDFAPITKFASVPNILAARPAFPVRTVQALVDYAKSNPGKVTWASSGTGSGGTMAMELFRLNTGIKVVHVPYKGAGPATVGLLSNEADLLFANPGVFMPHIKSGRLRAIAVGSAQRLSVLPDIPTLTESGFPGFESASWYGLAAPARTPAAIITLLHSEIVKVLNQPEIVSQFAVDGAQPVGNSPQAFAQEIRDDISKWAKVIKEANIKL
ncbi:MAG: Bug family tripartite tricarboxylate transporter substrate binding protein [Burkholderiales bacterium]